MDGWGIPLFLLRVAICSGCTRLGSWRRTSTPPPSVSRGRFAACISFSFRSHPNATIRSDCLPAIDQYCTHIWTPRFTCHMVACRASSTSRTTRGARTASRTCTRCASRAPSTRRTSRSGSTATRCAAHFSSLRLTSSARRWPISLRLNSALYWTPVTLKIITFNLKLE